MACSNGVWCKHWMEEKFFVWNPQEAHVNFSPSDEIIYSSH
ncbi:hypothetical protein VIBHAR_05937 [Vibrio campbellii ATCC BAA-1116]|uniref:Uncharacterized protein n=1 Tax=Vibrio campbellii (strain ATCC BAA-1116) TaxID=2902295 RepID=A7N5E3_VIBC1|nr:hypothetical protein VIBHAR_05937 [Vibrio campbellii ATCC BAA-1116]